LTNFKEALTEQMISIALCTYNGGQYLKEQLESIAAQTVKPGEIVICDDGSKDNTISVAKEFALQSNIPVHIHINPTQLGITKNFRKAILLCKGDYIALSDQDDVWTKDKLEIFVAFLSSPANQHTQVAFSNLLVVDDKLQSMNQTMWERFNFNSKVQKEWRRGGALDILLRKGNIVTGASMMLRSSFIHEIDKPLTRNFKIWIHDGIIALVAVRTNSIDFIDKVTVLYRQHETQSIGLKYIRNKISFFARLREAIKGDAGLKKELELELAVNTKLRDDLLEMGFESKQLKVLNRKIRYFSTRKNLPGNKLLRIPVILRELFSFRYYKYSRSMFLNAIKDFFRN
jgi:glycosyltransferase involved in cell wall biosynthesis